MAGAILNLALGVAAVYFYASGNSGWALLFAGLLAYHVVQNRLARTVSIVTRLQDLPSEHGCNTLIVCRLAVAEALAHPAVSNIFDHLRSRGKAPADSLEAWRCKLIDNFKRKYKHEQPFEEIRYNFKNMLMFTNGEVDFNDAVYHELEIPYEYEEGVEERDRFMTSRLEYKLTLRLLMVNGMLRLQVGEYDKATSPNIFKPSTVMAAYDSWTTLTVFPFMYFSHRHNLPIRYLNLASHATDSYKASLADRAGTNPKKSFWNRAPGRFDDWKTLRHELRAYRILCDQDSTEYRYSTLEKLTKAFEKKRDALLRASEFHRLGGRDAEDGWRDPDVGEEYSNKYLYIWFRDLNQWRDYAGRHWFTDYYEEQP